MKMLIVDDSLIIRRKIEREINLPDLTEIVTAIDGEDAIEMFLQHRPELVTMDLTMPRMEGTECVKQLIDINPDAVILVVSALADKATAIKAVKNGAYGFLCKPFKEEELNEALSKCIAFSKGLKISMISEKDIEVFIDGIKHYFATSTESNITVETPYLIETDAIEVIDYTGIIGISGERKGFVLFTAPVMLLQHLVLSLGEQEATPNLIHDVVGEVANTISGNARRSFGAGFMISVPLIVQGQPNRIGSVKDSHGYVIPARWNGYSFQLIVSLE